MTAEHGAMLDRLRGLLTAGGRSAAQGALAWLWARNPRVALLPGFRSMAQVEDLCGALAMGPLDPATMAEVETVLARPPEGPPRER